MHYRRIDESLERAPDDTKLKKAKAGHEEILGETVAKFELFRNGWNPYSRFLDHEKIDLVARNNTGRELPYADVQVKKGTLYRVGEKAQRKLFDVTCWRFHKETEFDNCNPNLVLAVVLIHPENGESIIDYRGDIFLFLASRFAELLRQAVPSKDSVKVYMARSCEDPSNW